MIHELRTYTVHQGQQSAYLDLIGKVGIPIRGNECGTFLGFWSAEFGQLNQVWHLWSYQSLDERARLRAALGKNQRWNSEFVPRAAPMVARQDIR